MAHRVMVSRKRALLHIMDEDRASWEEEWVQEFQASYTKESGKPLLGELARWRPWHSNGEGCSVEVVRLKDAIRQEWKLRQERAKQLSLHKKEISLMEQILKARCDEIDRVKSANRLRARERWVMRLLYNQPHPVIKLRTRMGLTSSLEEEAKAHRDEQQANREAIRDTQRELLVVEKELAELKAAKGLVDVPCRVAEAFVPWPMTDPFEGMNLEATFGEDELPKKWTHLMEELYSRVHVCNELMHTEVSSGYSTNDSLEKRPTTTYEGMGPDQITIEDAFANRKELDTDLIAGTLDQVVKETLSDNTREPPHRKEGIYTALDESVEGWLIGSGKVTLATSRRECRCEKKLAPPFVHGSSLPNYQRRKELVQCYTALLSRVKIKRVWYRNTGGRIWCDTGWPQMSTVSKQRPSFHMVESMAQITRRPWSVRKVGSLLTSHDRPVIPDSGRTTVGWIWSNTGWSQMSTGLEGRQSSHMVESMAQITRKPWNVRKVGGLFTFHGRKLADSSQASKGSCGPASEIKQKGTSMEHPVRDHSVIINSLWFWMGLEGQIHCRMMILTISSVHFCRHRHPGGCSQELVGEGTCEDLVTGGYGTPTTGLQFISHLLIDSELKPSECGTEIGGGDTPSQNERKEKNWWDHVHVGSHGLMYNQESLARIRVWFGPILG